MTEQNPGGEVKPEETPKFSNDQLAKGIAFLMQRIEQISQGMTGIDQRVGGFEERLNSATPPVQAKEEPNEPPNLDDMTGSQLVSYLIPQIKKELIDPLKGELTDTRTDFQKREAQREVEKAAGTYKDFAKWDAEISAKIKSNPSLSLDDAYVLVRAANPEKAKGLDEALAKAAKPDNGEEEKPAARSFGGLLPTSSISSDSTAMELSEAGKAAWDEVMSDFAELTDK